jgi:hypothetical protein
MLSISSRVRQAMLVFVPGGIESMNEMQGKLVIAALLVFVLSINAFSEDTLSVPAVVLNAGQDGVVSIYLKNTQFDVGGFSLRMQLADSTYVSIVDAQRGSDIEDFEYFYARISDGTCRITSVYNWPGGGDPPPLSMGYHEIARVLVHADSLAPPGFSDSIYFRDDTIPPNRDNSISDDTGYLNSVPELIDGVIEIVSPTGLGDENAKVPEACELMQNYPNPFNAETRLRFALSVDSDNVRLVIFDILGRIIKNFEFGNLTAGDYSATWNGNDGSGNAVSSGVYFYRLNASLQRSEYVTPVMRMTLLR